MARNKISQMKKNGLLEYEVTGLSQPKYSIVLTNESKRIVKDFGYTVSVQKGAINKIKHLSVEQLAFYHLSKLGEVKRISVWHHKNVYHAVPDLILQTQINNIPIEVEIHQKGRPRYEDYVSRAKKDNFDKVLFIMPTKKLMITIANNMPTWDKLFYIDIETMIENIKVHNKIKPYTQKALYKS